MNGRAFATASAAAALPGVDRLGIELPNSARVAELGLEGHARRCLERAKALLETPKS